MQITNERPSTDVIMDFDMTDEEYELLLGYAKRNMPEEELNKIMVEWSILEAIKAMINKREPEELDENSES